MVSEDVSAMTIGEEYLCHGKWLNVPGSSKLSLAQSVVIATWISYFQKMNSKLVIIAEFGVVNSDDL